MWTIQEYAALPVPGGGPGPKPQAPGDSLWGTWWARINIPDFTISANPSALFTQPTTETGPDAVVCTATSTITTTGIYGFNSNIDLTVSSVPPLPAGWTATLVPTTITGGTGTSVLTVAFDPTIGDPTAHGTFVLTVTGTGGSIVHTTTVNLTIQNFTVAADPNPVLVQPGGSADSTVTITPEEGFAGSVDFSIDPATPIPAGMTVVFTPTSSVSASTLTVTLIDPSYVGCDAVNLNIVATSGCTVHRIPFTVQIKNFAIAATPKTANAYKAGATAKPVTITTTICGGWDAAINLTVTGLPVGAKYTLKPNATIGRSGSRHPDPDPDRRPQHPFRRLPHLDSRQERPHHPQRLR